MSKKEIKKNLTTLTKTFRDILKISKKYSYLWDNDENFKENQYNYVDKNIYLARGFIAADESFSIFITRKNKKFVFDGRGFCSNESGLNATEAAKRILMRFDGYNITEEKLRRRYFEGLKEILSRDIARKGLKEIGLENEVMKNEE
ncbi:MAG: hypothetical protein PVJ67_01440 [Candidatus Pacearchaeota archaeon]|jgi:hypothetical protein